jgi:hypothetical protein
MIEVTTVLQPATFAPFLGGRCGCGRTPDLSICSPDLVLSVFSEHMWPLH